MKRKLSIIAMVLVFALGVGIMCYPVISAMINNSALENQVTSYTESLNDLDEQDYSRLIKEARSYNKSLNTKAIITDPFDEEAYKAIGANYNETLNYRSDGMICTVEVPKIHINLPVYHGTEDDTLAKGSGHLPNTSMPIGGKSTHSVIAAHSGYPDKTFFDYLTDMEVGDVFYIHILNQTLKYQVDQIKVVLPENVNDLRVVKGQDYVTLLTCTPYAVNTHRLLVRGKRVAYNPDEETDSYSMFDNGYMYLFGYRIPYWVAGLVMAGFVLIVVLIVVGIVRKNSRKKRAQRIKEEKPNEKQQQ
jgi:sortase A